MKKKFTFVIAMLLVVALAMPASAAVFTDVSTDHWAYEAVNKLVAAGIIEGYPDGTFKGDENVTRYEVAMMVNRALERIAEERASLEDEVDAMKDGFTSAQETELEDIVKSIVEENMPEPKEEESEDTEGLNEKEYEQIANLVEALTFNYKAELKNLGSEVDELEDLVDSNKEETDATIDELKTEMNEKMNKVTFSGDYTVDYVDVGVEGDGTPYYDPYTEDYDDDDSVDAGYDYYDVDADTFYHELTMDTAIESGPLSADFSMVAGSDYFEVTDESDDFGINVGSLSGQISGNGFEAWIEEDQDLTIKPYLFDGSEDADGYPEYPVNGVIVSAFDNTYALSDDVDTVFAATEEMDLLGQTFDFAFGTKNEINEPTNRIVGVGSTMNFVGFEVNPEFAISNESFDERYFTLNTNGDLGPVELTYNLSMIEDEFEEIKAAETGEKGHDVLGETSLWNIDLSAYYDNYEDFNDQYIDVTAEITEENAMNFAGFSVYADTGFSSYLDYTDATRTVFNTTAENVMGSFTLTGELNYEDTSAAFETQDADRNEYTETELFDKIGTVEYDLTDAISASAEVVHDIDGELSQKYAANYEQGMFSAGITKYLNGVYYAEADNLYLTAAVDPEAYNVMNVSFDPYANFGMKMDADNYMNYALGFDAEKDLNEYAVMTGGFEYADKEYDIDNAGTKMTYDLGMEYTVAEDVDVTANYEVLDFTADSGDVDSYTAEKATAGVSVSF